MAFTIDSDRFLTELMQLFEETFETHHGIFLDKGTSLLETLSSLTASQVSKPMGNGGATIAAHVAHVDFYLSVIEHYLFSHEPIKADWRGVWNTVSAVTPDAWTEQLAQLKATYQRVSASLQSVNDWNDSDRLSAAMAMIVHTAVHLGAIRQGLRILRQNS
jgi:hypothetical protein